MRRSLVSLAIMALVLTACADAGGSTNGDPTGTEWELQSGTLDGEAVPIIDTHPITLAFTEDTAGGIAACNSYGGEYQISGDEITIAAVFQTEMACTPDETMESEQIYLSALVRVETFAISDGMLTLSGEGVELIFAELPPVPTAELTGTVWVLDGMIQGDAVSSVMGERATLEFFTDGSLLGSTGCRSISGTYTVSGSDVVVEGMTTEGDCAADLASQDEMVASILGDGFRTEIEGGTLTLVSDGGDGLVYRAEG